MSGEPKGARRFLRIRSFGAGDDLLLATVLQAACVLMSFVVQALLLRGVSKELAGEYFFVVAIASISSVVIDFGLVAVIIPRVVQAGTIGLPIVRVALRMRLALVAAVCLLVPLGAGLIYGSRMGLLVFLALAVTAFGGRAVGLRPLFELGPRLSGRIYIVNMLALLDLALQALCMWITFEVMGIKTVEAALAIAALCTLPGFLILVLPQLRRVWRAESTLRHRALLQRALLRTALPILLLSFVGQFSAQLETLVLELTAIDRTAVAAYNAAIRPVVASLFIATSVSVVIMPFISRSFRNALVADDLRWLVSFGGRLLGVLGLLIVLGTWGLSGTIMRVFGEQYSGDGYIMTVYAWINLLVYVVVMGDQILIATNRRTRALGGALLQLAVALALELVLVGSFGLWGLLAGKAVAYIALVIYQIGRYPAHLGSAQLRGLLRLLPAIAALIAAQCWFGLHPTPVVAVAVSLGVIGVLAASRILVPEEILRFRRLRLA